MPEEPLPKRRNSLRLYGYDYTAPGCYFITIVTQNRVRRFGNVNNGEMELNEAGKMVEQSYLEMLKQYADLSDIAHVLMPNHLYGFLSNAGEANVCDAVKWLKSRTTSGYIHGMKEQGWPTFDKRLWQTRFYDVIARNQQAYQLIVNYIYNNPLRWSYDLLNEECIKEKADEIGKELKVVNW